MTPIQSVAIILLVVMALFVWNRLPVIVVAFATALALWATGIVTLNEALAGFGDPSVAFIAALFVVSAALEATGVTAWVGQKLVGDPGRSSLDRLLLTLMALSAGLTALISANGAVAALLPIASVAAVRLSVAPSRVLLPLAFAAHAGSNLVLTGAPKNVLVSDALVDAGFAGFGYFEFAFVGVPLVAGTLLIVALLGHRLLPERRSRSVPADLSRHARVLVEQFGLVSDTFKLRVRRQSPLVGRDVAAEPPWPADLRVLSMVSGATGQPLRGPVSEGDFLLVRGEGAAVTSFAQEHGLAFRDLEEQGGADTRFSAAPAALPRSSSAPLGARRRAGLPGHDHGGRRSRRARHPAQRVDRAEGETELAVGDTLLLQGTWKALDQRLGTPDVLIVDSPELVRRQAVPLGKGASLVLAVVAGMILLLATGAVPPPSPASPPPDAAAGDGRDDCRSLLPRDQLDHRHPRRGDDAALDGHAVDWSSTRAGGGAGFDGGPLRPHGASCGSLRPHGYARADHEQHRDDADRDSDRARRRRRHGHLATSGHDDTLRRRRSILHDADRDLDEPDGHGPGGYAFGDYWRLGLPLMALYFVVAVVCVPLIWPF